jgi:single-stranded DNA-binding protein
MFNGKTASAEKFAKLARRGQEIFVEGSIRQDRWEDGEGRKRSRLYLNVLHWQFTQRKAEEPVAKNPPAAALTRKR